MFNKDPYLITRNKELCILECRVFRRIWMGPGQTWLFAWAWPLTSELCKTACFLRKNSFFCLWDYYFITNFLLSLPSLQALHVFLSFLLQIHGPFSLIVVACVQVFVYMYIFLNITCQVNIKLLECMFLGLFDIEQPIGVPFPGKDPLSQFSSVD